MSASHDDLVPLDFAHEPKPLPQRPDESWTGRSWLGLALCVGALLIAAGALLAASAHAYIAAPYSDVHAWIARVFALEGSHDWLGYLWEPHTAQRIPVARLVTALDVEMVRARAPSFLIACVLAWALGLAGLFGLIARAPYAVSTRLALAAAAGALALNIGLAEDFALPVFSVYLFVAGPAIGALALAARTGPAGWRAPAFWAAMALAWLAACGNAAGLAVWPALLAVLAVRRADRPTLILALAFAVLCIVAIEGGLDVPSTSLGKGGDGVAHVGKILLYFLVFGALPWSRAVHPLAVQAALGLLVWAVAAFALREALRDRRASTASAAVGLILFGLITAAMASVGRVDELPTVIVPTRYTPFATVLQVGVLLGFASRWDALRERPWRVGLPAALVVVLVLAATPHGMRAMDHTAAAIRAASDRFDRTGRLDDPPIYPIAGPAAAVRAELARRGLPH